MRRLIRTALLDSLRSTLPARHRLGFDLLIHRLRKRVEEELLYLPRISGKGDLAVDVGANQGYYSYVLAKHFKRVLAFEPNPSVVSELERCGLENVVVHNVALSSSEGELELHVPRVNGIEQHGWASFDRQNLPEATDFRVLDVPVRRLDSYGLEGLSFLKIDVEGHEPAMLAGAVETLRANRPVVLIEVKDRNRAEVMETFEGLNYSPYRLRRGELVPWHPDAANPGENFIFKPDRTR